MYAVVDVAGCQFRVQPDQVLQVPLLDVQEGATVTFDQVLLVQTGETVKVGTPTVPGASVSARILGHARGPKLEAGQFIRRKDHHRRWGHRQDFTEIQIASIQG